MAIVLRPQGKLDLIGSATLQQKLERVANISSGTSQMWIVDLAEVNFINHFGLTTLMAARRLARDKGCRLFLSNIKPPIQLMLEIAQISQEFEIVPSQTNIVAETGLPQPVPQNRLQSNKIEILIQENETEQKEEFTDAKSNTSTTITNLQRILETFKSKLNNNPE